MKLHGQSHSPCLQPGPGCRKMPPSTTSMPQGASAAALRKRGHRVTCNSTGGGGGQGPRGPLRRLADDEAEPSPAAWLHSLVLCLSLSLTASRPASALFNKKHRKRGQNDLLDKYSREGVAVFWPMAQNLGFSGFMGYIAALALKTVGYIGAVIFGVFFAMLQYAAYRGWVKVNWSHLHSDLIRAYDVNRDGKFDASDAQSLVKSLLAVLSQGVPSVGGFCSGFLLGIH